MTIHASKGLEFDYVFIVGLEEDLFPAKNFSGKRRSKEEEEEERRLFYVAVTRAKKKLYLSFAEMRQIFGKQISLLRANSYSMCQTIFLFIMTCISKSMTEEAR